MFRPTTLRRLASSFAPPPSPGANPFKPDPMALLPPLQLYRRVLRANRRLPAEERTLGDMYAKAEFRAHKNVDNPVHIIGFLTQWQLYAQQIEGDSWRGAKIDPISLDKLSDHHVGQLYELMQAIKDREHKYEDEEPPQSS